MASTRRPAPIFPRLPPGRSAGGVQRAARHRRGRLKGAMVAAVGEHGYPETTITELVTLAGISKRDFYEIFSGKDECFLATFEEIIEEAVSVARASQREGGDLRGRLLGSVEAFGRLLSEEPSAARLAIVDSLNLGPATVPLRERAEVELAELLRAGFDAEPERGEVSEVAIRGLVGGMRRVVYASLRAGRPERLGEHAGELVEWVLSYQRPDGSHVLEDALFAGYERVEVPRIGAKGAQVPSWVEPPSSELSRKTLTARERILRAAVQIVATNGYGRLSIPAISSTAGISNATFYREFKSKDEALMAAFDGLVERAAERATLASSRARSWPEGVGAALLETLAFISRNPVFARLTFEVAAAGAGGLEHGDKATRRQQEMLAAEALPDEIEPLAPIVVEAIIGGIWTVIKQEIAQGRVESLPELAPELADFALVPFGVG
ncbi:MAG TPA: TetR/AcrR family transcriptional regulator [Solirubrobacterales bacterium]